MSIWDDLGEFFEDVGDFLSNPKMQIARGSAKSMAAHYNLGSDGEAFEELWGLTINARLVEAQVHDRAIDEVERLIGRLPALVDRAPDRATLPNRPVSVLDEPGMEYVHVAETDRPYAIFSDHHMLFDGHRQNYFETQGNRDLYVEILNRFYAPAAYTLVENGDVEELIILEPKLNEINNIGQWSWAAVKAYRDSKKEPQLRSIVRSNLSYYRAVTDGFAADGRYFKITGNHDRDMVSTEFAEIVSDELGTAFPRACDVLLLRNAVGADYIICHGHQFDTACTPKFAMKGGESFSQSAAWAFQGPDRIWRTRYDQMQDWLDGSKPVLNSLVSDIPQGNGWIEETFDDRKAQEYWDAFGSAISNLNTERGWETLYGKNIAWNYFENAGDPQKCIKDEVKTGQRWFKFRHMNELRLANHMKQAFGDTIPWLALGHTHEPRMNAVQVHNVFPAIETEQIGFYLNSGSAGRFQNLIWGLEIVEGAPTLISWHRGEDGEPRRTLWEDFTAGYGGFLRPAATATIGELLAALEVPEPAPVADDMALRIATTHVL